MKYFKLHHLKWNYAKFLRFDESKKVITLFLRSGETREYEGDAREIDQYVKEIDQYVKTGDFVEISESEAALL